MTGEEFLISWANKCFRCLRRSESGVLLAVIIQCQGSYNRAAHPPSFTV